MGKIFPAEQELDERDINEWMRDQGLDAPGKGPGKIKPNWISRSAGRNRVKSCDMSIAKTAISFSPAAAAKIGPCILIGTGTMDGKEVILIRPAKSGDGRAYRVQKKGEQLRSYLVSSRVASILMASFPLGEYRLVAIKGGYYAVPEEEGDETVHHAPRR